MVDTSKVAGSDLDTQLVATLRGNWGFDTFAGPSFHLRNVQPDGWGIVAADRDALIVGRDDTLHLQSICAVCAEKITLNTPKARS